MGGIVCACVYMCVCVCVCARMCSCLHVCVSTTLSIDPQEWLWVVGYFLRARLQFAHRNGIKSTENLSMIHSVLSTHAQALQHSLWKGLPELTNKDGTECVDSCSVQAWSMATLLDVLHDLRQYS